MSWDHTNLEVSRTSSKELWQSHNSRLPVNTKVWAPSPNPTFCRGRRSPPKAEGQRARTANRQAGICGGYAHGLSGLCWPQREHKFFTRNHIRFIKDTDRKRGTQAFQQVGADWLKLHVTSNQTHVPDYTQITSCASLFPVSEDLAIHHLVSREHLLDSGLALHAETLFLAAVMHLSYPFWQQEARSHRIPNKRTQNMHSRIHWDGHLWQGRYSQ